jgi:hypothetical protein
MRIEEELEGRPAGRGAFASKLRQGVLNFSTDTNAKGGDNGNQSRY